MTGSGAAQRRWVRAWIGVSLGLSALGACAGAMPEGAAGDLAADPRAPGAGQDAGADAVADGDCPHGRLEDPHRGFVRCLQPDEADASWLPPRPQPDPADAGVPGDAAPPTDAAPPADAALPPVDAAPPDATPLTPPPGPPPLVEFKPAAFTNGDVPNVDKRLQKLADGIATCVAEGGGLSSASGSLKLQFLVRERGRAEGVEILGAKGVSAGAQECVRLLLKNKPVGTPSSDPVGVTVTISLKTAK